ncbi:MAG: histidine phosphatase family protein [Verrucomicrobiaceae bacterium]|nr:histidine phosphatase family protein [Verrucomicrobiaceae bacterium]
MNNFSRAAAIPLQPWADSAPLLREMKYLTVVRHAKSSWDQPGIADHERPLNERGLRSAPAVAKFLSKTYFGGNGSARLLPTPDRIISSTAVRALTTAQSMRESLGVPQGCLALDSRLYLAEPETVLDVVSHLNESAVHAMIFGHNPGLHDFVNKLLSRSSVPSMPTCAAVIMALPHEYWGMAHWREAQLIAYVTPKALERRFPSEYAGISKPNGDD